MWHNWGGGGCDRIGMGKANKKGGKEGGAKTNNDEFF